LLGSGALEELVVQPDHEGVEIALKAILVGGLDTREPIGLHAIRGKLPFRVFEVSAWMPQIVLAFPCTPKPIIGVIADWTAV
jgi:hypothetical protein